MTTKKSVACRCCGVATDQNVTTQVAHDVFGRPKVEYQVGVCDDCLPIAVDEPGSAVRAALRVIKRPVKDWPLAAEAFAEAGLDVTPMLYDKATPQRKAFGHVPGDVRDALKRAYLRVLDAKVHASADSDRPVPPHAPPEDSPHGACLACGVGKAKQWRGPVTTAVWTKPTMTTGYLCLACGEAAEQAGALGPGLLERALLAHRGIEHVEGLRLPRLRAWVSQPDLSPGDEPWAWVGEVREPEPALDLPTLVADLTRRVADLEARLS